MRTVAFDGAMGASGDMLLGAMLAAGADSEVLEPIEEAIDVRFAIDEIETHGIRATTVTVTTGDSGGHHTPAEGSGSHRAFDEVIGIVESMELAPEIESRAIDTFRVLGEAEATVHGTSLEETHFHEVGADDAIADVTGSAALLADLDVDRIVTGPVSTGTGEVETSHGVYPVPPPAVVEIAERTSLTLRGGPVASELLTPTGAAVLGSMAESVETLPALSVSESGYGAGRREFADRPNVLRAIAGETVGSLQREDIRVLETHLDDATPEVLGHLQERLRETGARDVACIPMTMKKSRPGHLVKVVVDPADAERVARALAHETGTLGVRSSPTTHRWVAERSVESVTIDVDGRSYEIGVKVATDAEGTILDRSAEYEDAAAVAREVDRPVRDLMRLAEREAVDTRERADR